VIHHIKYINFRSLPRDKLFAATKSSPSSRQTPFSETCGMFDHDAGRPGTRNSDRVRSPSNGRGAALTRGNRRVPDSSYARRQATDSWRPRLHTDWPPLRPLRPPRPRPPRPPRRPVTAGPGPNTRGSAAARRRTPAAPSRSVTRTGAAWPGSGAATPGPWLAWRPAAAARRARQRARAAAAASRARYRAVTSPHPGPAQGRCHGHGHRAPSVTRAAGALGPAEGRPNPGGQSWPPAGLRGPESRCRAKKKFRVDGYGGGKPEC
jgi:hypothetical protein